MGLHRQDGQGGIEPRFDETGPYDGEVAWAKLGDKWGFINRTGKWVIEPTFDRPAHFLPQGIARVQADGGTGWIDKTGKYIWEPTE